MLGTSWGRSGGFADTQALGQRRSAEPACGWFGCGCTQPHARSAVYLCAPPLRSPGAR